MKYQVAFKIGFKKRVLRNVVADGIIEGLPYRYFILETGERYEVPMNQTVFWFSKGRLTAQKQNEKNKFQDLKSGIEKGIGK